MMKFRIYKNNLFVGLLLSYILCTIIRIETFFIIFYLNKQNLYVYSNSVEILSIIIRIIIFIIVVKKFYKIKSDRLNFYFISSIIFSIFITIESFSIGKFIYSMISSKLISPRYNNFLVSDIGSFIMGNFIVINLLFLIAIFLIVFTLFINRKVNYIKYITMEIKKIENEGFGRTIIVKGNDELSELSKSINRMSIKLRDQKEKEKIIENNKNELITNVSHDLRTPLTSINGYIELLKELDFDDKEKFYEYISVVDKRTKGLTTLVNELFEYTKLNTNEIKLNISNVNIVSLVSHIANEYSIIFEKNNLTLERNIINKEILMNVDIEKMVRVLQNILTNANKYSINNSVIILALIEDKEKIILSVSNRTNEIKQIDLPNILNRFYKADKSRNCHENSGLGLSIAKKLVELHNGWIDVNLSYDIFTLTIFIPK